MISQYRNSLPDPPPTARDLAEAAERDLQRRRETDARAAEARLRAVREAQAAEAVDDPASPLEAALARSWSGSAAVTAADSAAAPSAGGRTSTEVHAAGASQDSPESSDDAPSMNRLIRILGGAR